MAESVEEIKKHVRIYMMVFGALAVLTVVTVGVGYLDLPIIPALAVGLTIALIKGGLVAGYFMHLISEKRMIYGLLIMTVAFFIFMVLIFMSAYYDQAGSFIVS